MSLAELLPQLRSLPRADKLHVIHELAGQLAAEEAGLPAPASDGSIGGLIAPGAYPVWSPFDAFAAADALLTALAEERGRS